MINSAELRLEDEGFEVEELLRRAHATFLRLNQEIRSANEREAAARERLTEAQREADGLCARALPLVERITETILAEADEVAATILAAGGARAGCITAEVEQVARHDVAQVRRALDEARRAERQQVADALGNSQRRLDRFLETEAVGAAPPPAPPAAPPAGLAPPVPARAREPIAPRTRHESAPATVADDDWLAALRSGVAALESLEPDPADRSALGA